MNYFGFLFYNNKHNFIILSLFPLHLFISFFIDGADKLQSKLNEIEKESSAIHSDIAVNGILALLFGPRGIQHFIYLDIINMLQTTANGYLNILSNGGLQLGLQSLQTEETKPSLKKSSGNAPDLSELSQTEDKIVKSVYIRNSSNNYSERSLSQLSGGQYRRVSLALDLAFTGK